ncbi:hypothetical protein DZS_08510 [Dickeya ananatis]
MSVYFVRIDKGFVHFYVDGLNMQGLESVVNHSTGSIALMTTLALSQRLLPLISGRGRRARVRAMTHPDSP